VPKVTNTTGIDLYLAATQQVVADGESISVPEEIAESLKEQGWKIAAEQRKQSESKTEETAKAEVN
jgi:hypothetical protein